jgi:hypothetical protein
MRFFKGTSEQFDAIRDAVMQSLGMPNGHADEPWPAGISTLALGTHHYEPDQYSAMIEQALAIGITEITAEEYAALQPKQDLGS